MHRVGEVAGDLLFDCVVLAEAKINDEFPN